MHFYANQYHYGTIQRKRNARPLLHSSGFLYFCYWGLWLGWDLKWRNCFWCVKSKWANEVNSSDGCCNLSDLNISENKPLIPWNFFHLLWCNGQYEGEHVLYFEFNMIVKLFENERLKPFSNTLPCKVASLLLSDQVPRTAILPMEWRNTNLSIHSILLRFFLCSLTCFTSDWLWAVYVGIMLTLC